MNLIFVAGDFNEDGGKPSGYARKLFASLVTHTKFDRVTFVNGGTMGDLDQFFNGAPRHESQLPHAIVWMPNISNSNPKRVQYLKELYPRSVLVTSKNNLDGKYPLLDILARALRVHANLTIEIRRFTDGEREGQFLARVLDPLGSEFRVSYTRNWTVEGTGEVLGRRIQELLAFTRVHSMGVDAGRLEPPDESQFFEIARGYAQVYHELIHANTDRYLGNLSFRCERGFPAVRDGDVIFVSKRNVDKREITPDGMVAVVPGLVKMNATYVRYYGLDKPSVDAPIQVLLYERFPWVKYMLHSHVFIEGAKFTEHVIPCGALEEVEDIAALNPQPGFFAANLRGHGSIVLAENVEDLRNIKYVQRTLPEIQLYKD
jgi:hypothetical protein